MKNHNDASRRKFLKSFATSAAAVTIGTDLFANESRAGYFEQLKRTRFSANDNINIALIGTGGMGTQDVITALKVPGIKLVAICDLYDGRLEEGKKNGGRTFLQHAFTRKY